MRLLSLTVWGMATALVIGPAQAVGGSAAAIDLSTPNSADSLLTLLSPAAGSDNPQSALQAQFPGYGQPFGFAFDAPLLGLDSQRSPDAMLFQTQSFVSATIALASDMHIRLAEADARPNQVGLPFVSDVSQLQLRRTSDAGGSHSLLARADWDFASWGGLGIAGSEVQSDSYFGGPVGFQLPGAKLSTMLGVSAHLNFGDGWVTSFSYDEGRTQFDLRPSALSVADNAMDSSAFDIGVEKNDLFGADAMRVDLIRPVQPNANGLGTGNNYSVLLGNQISLSSATPETDLQLDYETSFNLPQFVELYINFGTIGVLLGMTFIGFLYALMNHSFSASTGGVVLACPLFAFFMNMESNFSLVFGGIPFFVILFYLLLLLLPVEPADTPVPAVTGSA